ncbi:MAG TPA: carboxypeptidase-like regulatory domain-containing protein [Candidatus Acidoferrum sp.]
MLLKRLIQSSVRSTRWASACLLAILVLAGPAAFLARAQAAGSTLSGAVKDSTGKIVAGAKIAIKNLATGQTTETQTDAGGQYTAASLAPGDYELSISAEGYSTNVTRITMSDANKLFDITLGGALSLSDLGFSQTQTQGSAQDQARLDKRSHMLKIHQRIGLIDAGPLLATVILGAGSGGRKTSSADRWAHLALGSVTGDLYFISAYYAIRAPKIPGTPTRGQIRWHKALAWIHGPGMIATPILGALAFEQKSNGEKVHGIAQAHGPVAIVTAAAYGAAILSVSLKF